MLLDALGTLLLGEEPLAVLAALDTSTLSVLVMAFFLGLRSGFLAYSYGTVFLFSLISKTGCRPYDWKRFIQSLVNTLTWYLQVQVLKTDLYGLTLTK